MWTISENLYSGWSILDGDTLIAQVGELKYAQQIAAAPELLAACKFFLEVNDADDAALCDYEITKAIAKAEGRSL